MDAGALDDLDLDGMFADDGDMLFEGLDIGLDPMGDMMGNDKSNAPPPPIEPPPEVAPPAPKPKRAGGPRTKRTNPMLENADGQDESGSSAKRRKTKRKSKGGLDALDLGIEEPVKKRRKSTLKGKKTNEPAPVATMKTKRKKSTTPGSSLLNSSTSPIGTAGVTKSSKSSMVLPTVAGAGQFGGRVKKAGSTKVKRKLKKSVDGVVDPSSLVPVEVIKPPKPEPTYGGLLPSKTLFYPFLESVPAESTMQKRKMYPVMDKLSSALTSQILAASQTAPPPSPVGLTKDSPVFKLMLDTYEGTGSDKDKKNFTPEKRVALLRGIFHLRKMIHKADKNAVVKDIFAMCGLLTREYNFLKQTLDNMKVWCKNEFDVDKYKETYEPPREKPKIRKWKCSTGVVKVKIVCTGYKEPKNSPGLFAILPAMVYDAVKPLSSPGTSSTSKGSSAIENKKGGSSLVAGVSSPKGALTGITKKKKIEKVSDKSKLKGISGLSQAAASPIPKTYADSTPISRRQQIIERVSQLALELESLQHRQQTVGKLDPVPEEQPPLHTTRMWDWLQAAGFYDTSRSSKRLASIKSPQICSRRQLQRIPTTILGHEVDNTSEDDGDEREAIHQHVSSNSLFDRLQSLLVEEDDENDQEANGPNDDDEDSEDEESLGFLEDDDDDDSSEVANVEAKIKAVENGELDKDTTFNVADLSELSLEERTFLHLLKAGLIKKSLYPSPDLLISTQKEEGFTTDSDEREKLDFVIAEMSNDLTRMATLNNTRIGFIERLTSDSDVYYKKQVESEQAVLIAKCQSLMRRTKEKARKAKQKKDENLNLPW